MLIIRLAAKPPRRWRPLSSNVRPHVNTSKAFIVNPASVRSIAECKSLQRPRLAGQSNQNQGYCRGAATFCAELTLVALQGCNAHASSQLGMVSSWSRLTAAEHRAFGRRSLVSSTRQLVMREAGASADRVVA